MRRRAVSLALLLLATAACATAWLACSSTDFSRQGGSADASDDLGQETSTPPSDAATADVLGDAGSTVRGNIRCEANPALYCEAGPSICCVVYLGNNYCAPAGSLCTSTSNATSPLECDDDTDCAPGNVCCGLPGSGQNWDSVRCQPQCANGTIRMCSSEHPQCPGSAQCVQDTRTTFMRICQ